MSDHPHCKNRDLEAMWCGGKVGLVSERPGAKRQLAPV